MKEFMRKFIGKFIIIVGILFVIAMGIYGALVLKGGKTTEVIEETPVVSPTATPSATLTPFTKPFIPSGQGSSTQAQPQGSNTTTGGSTTIINNPPAQNQPQPTPVPQPTPTQKPLLPLPTLGILGL